MIDLLARLREIKDALRLLLTARRVTITTVSPLTVTLPSGATIPATAVTGLTYTAGGHGVALISERSQPLVFPVA